MSDDLVTRLRVQPSCWCDGNPTRWQVQGERYEAADEIERLRKIIKDFYEAEREYNAAITDYTQYEVIHKPEWKQAWAAFNEEAQKEYYDQ